MRGKVSLYWQLPRENKPLGYTHTYLVTSQYGFPSNVPPYRLLLLLTAFPSMKSWGWGFWKTLKNSEIKVWPWISVRFADWNSTCSFENPSRKHYSQLIFKPAIPRYLNETMNSIMSVICFWHVKSATLYILFINVPLVKFIYRHETRCFIDVTSWCHTDLQSWASDPETG